MPFVPIRFFFQFRFAVILSLSSVAGKFFSVSIFIVYSYFVIWPTLFATSESKNLQGLMFHIGTQIYDCAAFEDLVFLIKIKFRNVLIFCARATQKRISIFR